MEEPKEEPQQKQEEISENVEIVANGSENGEMKSESEIKDENESNTSAEVTPREKELLDTVFMLESDKLTLIEETRTKLIQMRKELDEYRFENEKLKKKNSQIEQNLVQKECPNETKAKKDYDDILLKAKTLLFEKTKICKQQENHIQVLKEQVESIKEVLAITKDMLNLRNTEMKHLEDRLGNIDEYRKAEKERFALVERKLQISQETYGRLKQEYDLQIGIYKELKKTYELKIALLTGELEKLKAKPAA